jgi:hypothetical protein
LVKKSYLQDTEIQDTDNTVNVNGDVDTGEMPHQQQLEPDRTDLRRLPDLDQEREKTQYIAEFILAELGDEHSQAFYYLVAAKVPEHTIRKTLSEIRNDGARSPARVFAHRMKQYAADTLGASRHYDISAKLSDLSHHKTVGAHTE